MSTALRAVGLRAPLRLAAAVPALVLSDPMRNADAIVSVIRRAEEEKADYLALPELCLAGATAGTLLAHPVMLQACQEALRKIADATLRTNVTVSVGLPYEIGGEVLSAAAILRGGRVHAIIPAASRENPYGFLPALARCSSRRQALTPVPRLSVAFGNELFDREADIREGCVLLMPSSLNATARSFREVKAALAARSARTGMAIAYAAAGLGESTTSFVFDGLCAIAAGGEVLAVSKPLEKEPFVIAEVDSEKLLAFEPYPAEPVSTGRFVSDEADIRSEELVRILDLQAAALARRLTHIRSKGFVLGISGGLDSALALLAAAAAADRLNMPRSCIVAISMPGFGTSGRTKNNAELLPRALGCEYREISVVPASRQHFSDIGHDEANRNVVYENAQARERTKILLSIANAEGLLEVGTGDLSEIALGWCTFGGDHMAQYGINSSIPKTVIRMVVSAAKERFPAAADILQDILDTPVSPELLPTDSEGEIAQKTEEVVGSYELHDFFIWHFLKGKGPRELYDMAVKELPFPKKEIHRVLGVFLRRFFASQFKRNSAPEAPLVVASIAPDVFTMPSDMAGVPFMQEYESIPVPEEEE
ncbi:MAG: NAD(+) synthase [Clostridia bacterium]|nr:NAD(+) synthase [Clostridia bacterium]